MDTSAKKHQHVVPHDEQWAVKSTGAERASRVFDTRKEALEYAQEVAKAHNVCMVVHDDEGKFEEFDCAPEIKNQHVVSRDGSWAVIAEGGKDVSKLFPNKGAAMAHAYDLATHHNVCMLIHGKDGKFESVSCPPDGTPGILELIRIRLKR